MGGEPYTWRRVSTVRRQAVGNLPPKGGTAPTAEPTADGGFIRLKEISLSYDLPAKVLSFFRLNKLQFKIQATNLFLLYADSKLNGQDPEFFRSGGVSTPVPRQFTFTIRLGL